jgi:hypothetical protein
MEVSCAGKFRIYVKAYGFHFFRTSLWVTILCALLFFLLLFVPQAGELILSQATLPPAEESAGGFYWRLIFLNAAAALLAVSVWLSARILVETEARSQQPPGPSAASGPEELEPQPDDGARLADVAAAQAALYVPRQLGLSVFLTILVAAAGSTSEQGYWLPIALMLIWLFVLVMGLLRASGVKGEDLQGWWLGLLALVLGFAVLAFMWHDQGWLDQRAVDGEWRQAQRDALGMMFWTAVGSCLLLFAATPLIARKATGKWFQALASVLALALVIFSLYQAGLLTKGDWYWVFFLAQSIIAGLYWAAVLQRRKTVAWTRRFLEGSAPGRRLLHLIRRHVWLLTAAFIVLVTALMTLWAAFDPIGMGGILGAVGIVLTFLAFLVLLVALLQAWIGRSSWRRAVPAGTVGVVLLLGLFALPTRPQLPPLETLSPQPAAPLPAVRSLDQLPPDGYLFAIAAHGGGIRAAQYTASFVAWLDHETDYRFSERLVAASGASGGSVGLAVWSAARASGCAHAKPVGTGDNQIPACVHAVNETLAQDHLAPLLATGLFRDYMRFLSRPERGNTLQQSILHAASSREPSSVAGNLQLELNRALPYAPFALLLNSTQVGTAVPYSLVTREHMLPVDVTSPATFISYVPSDASSRVSLLTAAMHSARFPFVSPKAMVTPKGPTVVDGGYFDNSGVAVLRQHILALKSRHGFDDRTLKSRMVVISLESEPIGSRQPKEAGDGRNSMDEIFATILAARGAHGQAAWHQLCTELDAARLFSARPGVPAGWTGCTLPSEETLDPAKNAPLWQTQRLARAPALGWHLSRRSAFRVSTDAREKAIAIAKQLDLAPELPVVKGVAMRRMAK